MTLFAVTGALDVSVEYYARGARPTVYRIATAGELHDERPGALRLRLEADRPHFANSPVFFAALRQHQQARQEAGLPRVVKVLPPAAHAELAAAGALPSRIGREMGAEAVAARVAAGRGDAVIRVAVVNIFHQAFGDALASLVAIRELRRLLSASFGRVEIDLFQHRCNAEAESIYLRSGQVDTVHPLPAPLARLAEYDAYADTSGERVRTDAHWLDVCLAAFGIDPATVPAARKRIRVPAAPGVARELSGTIVEARRRGRPVVLFHPRASNAVRSCPDDVARGFVRHLLRRTRWTVASAVPLGIDHPRVLDWSAASRTFDHLACLVAHADGVVSADTVAYHLADAFDVPAVALFTSIPPACRTGYAPRVAGLSLAPEPNPLLGRGTSLDPAEIAVAEAMWRAMDPDAVIAALRAVRRRAPSPLLPVAA